jgi:hypothetical protein
MLQTRRLLDLGPMAATLVACGLTDTRPILSGFSIALPYRGYWLTRWTGTGSPSPERGVGSSVRVATTANSWRPA